MNPGSRTAANFISFQVVKVVSAMDYEKLSMALIASAVVNPRFPIETPDVG